MPQPQIPYYHLLNQWLLGATNGNQGQRMMHTPPHTFHALHLLHAPPTCTPHVCIIARAPSTHALCVPPTCALHIHPHVCITHVPPHALCVHLSCAHCMCCPHACIACAPPMRALPGFDWLSVPATANQITSF